MSPYLLADLTSWAEALPIADIASAQAPAITVLPVNDMDSSLGWLAHRDERCSSSQHQERACAAAKNPVKARALPGRHAQLGSAALHVAGLAAPGVVDHRHCAGAVQRFPGHPYPLAGKPAAAIGRQRREAQSIDHEIEAVDSAAHNLDHVAVGPEADPMAVALALYRRAFVGNGCAGG